MRYFITSDATTDFPDSLVKENFKLIPMCYLMNDVEYGIDIHLSSEEFYKQIAQGAQPTTSLITTYFAKEFFTPILKEGYDILHICFSSGLSGSYQNLVNAVEELKIEFPDRKILLIDSKCASMGEALLVYYSLKARDNGMSIVENFNYTSNLVQHICHYVTVDDLAHLHRGGRLSKASAIIGSVLKIKPMIYCNSIGKLQPIEKVISRKKALLALCDKIGERKFDQYENDYIFISHADSLEDVEFLAKKINEKYNFDKIIINTIGPVIGSHTGIGAIAMFFVGDSRVEAKDLSIAEA